ncbi:MAG: class I SAM-dependent methyltransferase [Candidatus Cloacimonetes bacterium]|nr:class I SAM-dependent methyltransferase [Candidatus Cloacimonadota bacterium]
MDVSLPQFLKLLSEEVPAQNREAFQGREWNEPRFAEWFFSENRHGYLDPVEEEEFLLQHAGSGPFLDLGCGNGRLSELLSDRFSGLALDSSFASIEKVKTPCIQADIRDLPVTGKFSLILLGFGQLCFLSREEHMELLKKLKRLLLPQGRIYLDLPTIELIQEMDSQNEFGQDGENTVFLVRQYDPSLSRLYQRSIVLNPEGKLLEDFSFAYQLYSLYELLESFRELRLRVEYGSEDLQGNPIKETSAWMVFLLQKI